METQNPTTLSLFSIATCFLLLSIMFLGVVKSQDQTPGLLCISECGTCPQVCSPPPSPEVALKPPPSPEVALKPPPLPEIALKPPPSPEVALKPPTSPEVALKPPPSPEVALKPPTSLPAPPDSLFPPPGAIITPIKPSPPVHNYPPSFPYYFLPPLSPPSRAAKPPPSPPSPTAATPPPSNNFNIPASVAPPAGFGNKNFSNPYYYFYVSEAASKTLCGPILAALLISFHVLLFLVNNDK